MPELTEAQRDVLSKAELEAYDAWQHNYPDGSMPAQLAERLADERIENRAMKTLLEWAARIIDSGMYDVTPKLGDSKDKFPTRMLRHEPQKWFDKFHALLTKEAK